MSEVFQRRIGDQDLIFEVGKVAGLANGAVTVRYGDTVVLVTACMSAEPARGHRFLPADGRLRGAALRRRQDPRRLVPPRGPPQHRRHPHGAPHRPTPAPALPEGHAQRRADRRHDALRRPGERPRHPLDHRRLRGAHDLRHPLPAARSPAPASATSTASSWSTRPSPSSTTASLDIVVAGTKDAIVMVEAGASEVSEEILLEAHRSARRTSTRRSSISRRRWRKKSASPRPNSPPCRFPSDIYQAVVDFANPATGTSSPRPRTSAPKRCAAPRRR